MCCYLFIYLFNLFIRLFFLKFFFKFLKFIYDSHREREREAETQAEGEAGSMHREPNVGFDSGSPGSHPGPKAGAKPLHHPGIPVFSHFIKKLGSVRLGRFHFFFLSVNQWAENGTQMCLPPIKTSNKDGLYSHCSV